ncbi:hypothetical protein GCM10010973_02410 [Cribrihabitans marinus]|nr:hypothetical protein GCM10010973_02410 [Cribrihabitans marinus]
MNDLIRLAKWQPSGDNLFRKHPLTEREIFRLRINAARRVRHKRRILRLGLGAIRRVLRRWARPGAKLRVRLRGPRAITASARPPALSGPSRAGHPR